MESFSLAIRTSVENGASGYVSDFEYAEISSVYTHSYNRSSRKKGEFAGEISTLKSLLIKPMSFQ